MIERHKDGLKLKPADVVECFVVEEESDVTMLQSRVRAEQWVVRLHNRSRNLRNVVELSNNECDVIAPHLLFAFFLSLSSSFCRNWYDECFLLLSDPYFLNFVFKMHFFPAFLPAFVYISSYLRTWKDRESEFWFLAVIDGETLQEEGRETTSGATAKRVEDEESCRCEKCRHSFSKIKELIIDMPFPWSIKNKWIDDPINDSKIKSWSQFNVEVLYIERLILIWYRSSSKMRNLEQRSVHLRLNLALWPAIVASTHPGQTTIKLNYW